MNILACQNIPLLLKKNPQWVLWKNTRKEGNSKLSKIPYNALTLRPAKSNDSTTWVDFDTAVSACSINKFDGIGFAFSEKSPYLCGIDIDHCVSADGTFSELAQKILSNFSNTYCEYSPSGQGLRIFCIGTPGRCGKGTDEKTIEVYNHTSPRYLTVTGHHIEGTGESVASCDDALEWLHQTYFFKKNPIHSPPNEVQQNLSDKDLLNAALAFIPAEDYEEWLHVGMGLKNSGYDIATWERWSQKSPKFCAGECAKKWNSFNGNGITVATIFQKAMGYGFTYPKKQQVNWHSEKPNPQKHSPLASHSVTSSDVIPFWYEIEKKRKNGDLYSIVVIDDQLLLDFLQAHGFGRYWQTDSHNEDTVSIFVRVVNRHITEVSIEKIQDFVFDYIASLPDGSNKAMLNSVLLNKLTTYFSGLRLKRLKPLDIKFHRDTEKSAFFYYKNCFVEVNAEGVCAKSYDLLDGVIWARQVIPREFRRLSPFETQEGVFARFQQNICRNRDEEFDPHGEHGERLKSLQCAIGYCLHRYRTGTRIAAVIFNDERISDEPRGRSGKGLTCAAISKIRTLVSIDGKQFDPDYQHNFQNVRRDTNLVLFDDLAKRFDFERLFALMSGGMAINIKGQPIPVEIQFADSPKFIMTTNYVVGGDSDSHTGRKWEITASPYYDVSFTPEIDFKMRLFEDFDAAEWSRFDNYMMLCAKSYFQWGMYKHASKNLAIRKLIQATNTDFLAFADEIVRDQEFSVQEVLRQFKQQNPDFEKTLVRTFCKWLRAYAKNHSEISLDERRTHGNQLFCFRTNE